MTQAATAAVRKQIVVDAPQDRAFTVFTENFGDFKPREHNLMRSPIARTVFEPRVGGHIVDLAEDGSECRWARVLVYEPHDRIVFGWDIGPDWQLVADPDNASEVEVRFIAETPERTRVELEHRHIDRHGPGWEAVRDGVDTDQGWPLYLDRYAAVVASGNALRTSGRDRRCGRHAAPEAWSGEPFPAVGRPNRPRQSPRGAGAPSTRSLSAAFMALKAVSRWRFRERIRNGASSPRTGPAATGARHRRVR